MKKNVQTTHTAPHYTYFVLCLTWTTCIFLSVMGCTKRHNDGEQVEIIKNKRNEQQEQKAKEAATKIQTAYRKYTTEKKYKKAATKIQTAYRKYTTEKKYKEAKEAATKIQTAYRKCAAEKKYKEAKEAATKIQTAYRKYTTEKKYKEAATKIQTAYRKCAAEKKYKKAATEIQTAYRKYTAEKKYKEAATKIQTAYRKCAAEKKYKEAKEAATKIQTAYRKYTTEKKYKEAAAKTQTAYRKYTAEKKYKEAATKIQTAYRKYTAEKKNRDASTKIQTKIREPLVHRRAAQLHVSNDEGEFQKIEASELIEAAHKDEKEGALQKVEGVEKTSTEEWIKTNGAPTCLSILRRTALPSLLILGGGSIWWQNQTWQAQEGELTSNVHAVPLEIAEAHKNSSSISITHSDEGKNGPESIENLTLIPFPPIRAGKGSQNGTRAERRWMIPNFFTNKLGGVSPIFSCIHFPNSFIAPNMILLRIYLSKKIKLNNVANKKYKEAATKFQAEISEYAERKKLSTAKEAATKIQTAYRKYTAEKKYKEAKEAATKIQTAYRKCAAEKKYKEATKTQAKNREALVHRRAAQLHVHNDDAGRALQKVEDSEWIEAAQLHVSKDANEGAFQNNNSGNASGTSPIIEAKDSDPLTSSHMRQFIEKYHFTAEFEKSEKKFKVGGSTPKCTFYYKQDDELKHCIYIACANDSAEENYTTSYITSGEQSIDIVLKAVQEHYKEMENYHKRIFILLQQLSREHWTILNINVNLDRHNTSAIHYDSRGKFVSTCANTFNAFSNLLRDKEKQSGNSCIETTLQNCFSKDVYQSEATGTQKFWDNHNCGRYALLKLINLLEPDPSIKSIDEINQYRVSSP
jgi:myosin heavy subunit